MFKSQFELQIRWFIAINPLVFSSTSKFWFFENIYSYSFCYNFLIFVINVIHNNCCDLFSSSVTNFRVNCMIFVKIRHFGKLFSMFVIFIVISTCVLYSCIKENQKSRLQIPTAYHTKSVLYSVKYGYLVLYYQGVFALHVNGIPYSVYSFYHMIKKE